MLRVRVLGELVAKETDVEWTFLGMFGARFMTPAQRERYVDRKTRVAVDIPVPGGATVEEPVADVDATRSTPNHPRVSA